MPGLNELLQAVLLGFVEGLTEFLPVSSTAHLLVTEHFMNLSSADWEVFTIVIQFGAILSVVAVYWGKFWNVLIGLPTKPEARKFTLGIIIAFLPAAVFGVLLIKKISGFLLEPTRALPVIGISWLVGGIIILLFERIAPKPRFMDGDNLPFWKCFQIGLCQCLAMLPGVSRSGATILGGELLGVERKAAAAFTFYLAVPTMLGASVYDLYKNWSGMTEHGFIDIGVGFVVSFIVAFIVVKTFIGFVGKYGLKPFGWYRVVSGIALLAYVFLMHR
jgi:undecaprenyl-diphosphatase